MNDQKERVSSGPGVSRRDFLRGSGAATATVTALVESSPLQAEAPPRAVRARSNNRMQWILHRLRRAIRWRYGPLPGG